MYLDNNLNVGFFTNDQLFEVETLGRLDMVMPYQTIQHQETWCLKMIKPLLRMILKILISDLTEKEKSHGKRTKKTI